MRKDSHSGKRNCGSHINEGETLIGTSKLLGAAENNAKAVEHEMREHGLIPPVRGNKLEAAKCAIVYGERG